MCGDVEANPGPGPKPSTLHLVTANVTSLQAHLELVTAFPATALLLQETRLGKQGQDALRQQIVERGWTPLYGQPQPLVAGVRRQSPWNAVHGGVAILVQKTTPSQLVVPKGDLAKGLWESGRWCHATIATGTGRNFLHLISVYGFAHDPTNSSNRLNDALLAQVFEEAASLGEVPVVIAGDFNILTSSSQTLKDAYSTGKWFDAADMWATANGVEPSATCSKGRPTRIDYMIVNAAALPAIQSVEVWEDSGLPTHRPVMLELDMEVFTRRALTLWRPRPLPVLSAFVAMTDEIEEVLYSSWGRWVTYWESAQGSSLELWKVLCGAVEDYILTTSTTAQGLPYPRRSYCGRGEDVQPARLKSLNAPQKSGGCDGALTTSHLRLLKLTHRVEAVLQWRQ